MSPQFLESPETANDQVEFWANNDNEQANTMHDDATAAENGFITSLRLMRKSAEV